VLAHAFFPQIPQGVLPVSVKELRNLGKMLVFQSGDSPSALLQAELRLRLTVRMVKDMHQLPDTMTEAVYKARILAFEFGHSLLLLYGYIARLLEEAPT
jgi:hypothetical protein